MKEKAQLKLIVCLGKDGLIGDANPVGNGLLWHSKEELTHYRETTRGHVTLFGKKTGAVVPVEIMRKTRDVIILDRDTDIDKILRDNANNGKIVFVCGGLSIYEYFLKNYEMDELLISKLKAHVEILPVNDPLYFPHVEDFGYKLFETVECDDFIIEKYRK